MTEKENDKGGKKKLSLSRPGKLELKKTVDAGQVRQSFSHGRSRAVPVEVRRKRTFAQTADGSMTEVKQGALAEPEPAPEAVVASPPPAAETGVIEIEREVAPPRTLTEEEKAARARALMGAKVAEKEAEEAAEIEAELEAQRQREAEEEEAARQAEAEARRIEEEARREAEAEASRLAAEQAARAEAKADTETPAKAKPKTAEKTDNELVPEEEEGAAKPRRPGRPEPRRPTPRRGEPRRRSGKLTVSQALDEEERVRSLASVRRARERERRAQQPQELKKVVRDVVVPETITVQELSNRMAERATDVIKALMKLGVMATITQSIDADTAELVVAEFGHNLKRVSAADVEIGLKGEDDSEESLKPRPPVVTVMGHVDHGKTSLLDALRSTDVVAGEAGGITQHIGAYQVTVESGERITFIDTPGHAAFTAMRARGANVTDIVILVVAADDGVMPQTIEAIDHAKAAGVPIIVAVNKMDRPDANPDRVRNELLQHEIVTESVGGEVLSIEVSATERTNLDKLVEAIVLQSEILELKANPERGAEGVVIEAKLERGRGPVATVLVQRGTLNVGDIVVVGGEWGRVRAMVDDTGAQVDTAGPSDAVELLGLNGTPEAGDEFAVVENEARARDIADFRQRREREARTTVAAAGTLDQLFSKIEEGSTAELPILIKADVQGSVEAIRTSAQNLGTDEVAVQILHDGVGGINESDITLAKASNAMVIGFNVRANPQARDLAKQENVDIRYYSIIYNVIDDLKGMLSGMLKPISRETIIGNAAILEVFNISKVGKVAGCKVSDGMVKRGASVRLLRDDVVIHEGTLSTLKRFKDEVREVREGFECGMAFENYQDIRSGDVIECFEVEEVARTL